MKQPNPDSILIKITLLLASTLTVMAGAIIAPSLPAMETHFTGVEDAEYLVKLALTIPGLSVAIGSSIVGILINRIGRKRLLLLSTLLYAAAGSAGFWLNSLWLIIVSRALLGLAVAGTMTGVMVIASDYYHGQKRANFMGLQAACMGLGGVVFVTLGGISADFNWRFPFVIYLFALLVWVLAAIALYEPESQERHHTQTRGSVAFPKGAVIGVYALATVFMVGYYSIFVHIPFYLQEINNASAAVSGMAIGVSTLVGAIASSQYGRLKKYLDFESITIIGFILIAIGQLIIGLAVSYQTVLSGLIVSGLGFGLVMPNLSNWLAVIVPIQFRGRILGGLTAFIFFGQFISPILSQPLIEIVGLGNTFCLSGGMLLQIATTLLVIKLSTAMVASGH